MIFVDSSAFLGWYSTRDQYHERARAFWQSLEVSKSRLYTSNFVLDEAITLLARRSGYPFAAKQARALYSSTALEIIRPTAQDELAALELFLKYADQRVSFTDCVSFALMRRAGLHEVFTFDGHFERAGFTVRPAL